MEGVTATNLGTVTLSAGQHAFRFTVTGKNDASNAYYFTVDSFVLMPAQTDDHTTPVTTSNAPEGWAKEDVIVTLSPTDSQSGVAKTIYSIDGADDVEGTSFTIKSGGVHTISFNSVDNAGNVEAAHTQQARIDKSAPVTGATVAPAQPDGSNEWYVHDVTLISDASDNLSGVSNTEYSLKLFGLHKAESGWPV
ncbi:hypothetical protein FHS19_000021 [Paenibacillus rhizosphaerae]|uniref:Bacterial Ig-like domain-containing protein n=1 Tax=Paenibacillus rhizosphaerae TaxID=297318 RepID=A0A839TKM0_9BACL|nr:hypothetical protein [Paenibacillus rhizosphaerae]MBB3125367.1 hypothetical protein [Paenibacillus rhizosphaerae]